MATHSSILAWTKEPGRLQFMGSQSQTTEQLTLHMNRVTVCGMPVIIHQLEKTLESPLDCKEIQPVHPKGDQSWVFIGRTDVKAETPILWPPDAKN